MAKPRLLHCNRLNTEGPGDGEEKEGGAKAGIGRDREGGNGKERATNNNPHPTHRRGSRRREGHPAGDRKEETEQEPEGAEEGKEEDRETPRGALVEVTNVGGDANPP